jgi:hypothetical protein
MGCLRRIGCLALLAALVVGALIVYGIHGGVDVTRWDGWRRLRRAATPVADSAWAPLTMDGVRRAENQVLALGAGHGGPVFTTVRPADFAGYMTMDVAGALPLTSDSAAAAASRDQLWIRTRVRPADLLRPGAMRWTLGLAGGRTPVVMAGTIDVIRPGLAEYRIETLRVAGVPAPRAMIPRIVQAIEAGRHPADVADNALLLNVPAYVADVRITPGKIVLYKSMP